MSQFTRVTADPDFATASKRVAKLHEVACLVDALIGGDRSPLIADPAELDLAHGSSSTLARARFDDFAGQTAALAAAGIEALLGADNASPAAIDHLARQIDAQIARLEALLIQLA